MSSFPRMLQFKQKMLPESQLLRWANWFSQWKFTVKHIKGKDNILADLLSRPKAYKSKFKADKKPPAKNIQKVFSTENPPSFNPCITECTIGLTTMNKAKAANAMDDNLKSLHGIALTKEHESYEQAIQTYNLCSLTYQQLHKASSMQKNTKESNEKTTVPQLTARSLMNSMPLPMNSKKKHYEEQLMPLKRSMQSSISKPKFAEENVPKTTTQVIFGQVSMLKISSPRYSLKKPETYMMSPEETLTQSEPNEVKPKDYWNEESQGPNNESGPFETHKYFRSGLGYVRDDDSDKESDNGSVHDDPGWDDYCIKELKLARTTLEDARKSRL